MTLSYTLRFRDLWWFNAVHHFRSIPAQILFLGLATLFAFSTASGSKCAGAMCAAVGAVVFVLVYLALLAFQLVFNAAFLYSRNNRNVLTHHRVEVKDEGLYEETTYSKCLFLWPGIHKVVRAAGITAVYVTAQTAILIPDRAFSSPSDSEELLRRVQGARKAI